MREFSLPGLVISPDGMVEPRRVGVPFSRAQFRRAHVEAQVAMETAGGRDTWGYLGRLWKEFRKADWSECKSRFDSM